MPGKRVPPPSCPWPSTVGTRLDDCQICHAGGTFTWMQGDTQKAAVLDACDFCHLVEHPPPPVDLGDDLVFLSALFALSAGRSRAPRAG